MPVRKIITHPATVLRRKAHKVTVFGSELQELIDDMVETMRQAPGVGLAAPQVDESSRVIVVEYQENDDEEDAPLKLFAVVNPEITRVSEETDIGTEGCLSIPGYVGDVERPYAVIVKGLNRFGKPLRIQAKGWLARIFQHEIDHLNGILFIDRATKVWKPQEEERIEAIAAD